MAAPLDAEARSAFTLAHPAWTLSGEIATRTLAFTDFAEAIGFVNRVALVAEKVDHHPDIDIRYTKVSCHLSTHSAGGITKKDFALAEGIDGAFRDE